MTRPLKPGDPFPVTEFLRPGGGRERIAERRGPKGLLLIVYRGMQCGHCKTQLEEFEKRFDDIERRGYGALAVSADTQTRALETQRELGLSRLPLAHGLREREARACGLFLSAARKDVEMPLFCEPGLFVVNHDVSLEVAWISSFAFPRPPADAVFRAMDMIAAVEKPVQPRGGA